MDGEPVHGLTAEPGPFRTAVTLYVRPSLLQAMQGTACNALHDLETALRPWLPDPRSRRPRRVSDETRVPVDHARHDQT
jgi:hypothetical protein